MHTLIAETLDRTRRNPLRYFRPTIPQLAYLSDSSRVKLLRSGNQGVGKTTAQAAETHYRCLGEHPYLQVHRPPIEAWVICYSWEQSIAVQTKLDELAPKDEIHPDCIFTPGKGYKGRTPIVRYRNGSVLRIKTTKQGSLGLSSATVHYVGIDEPPPPEIWSELQARVLRHRGVIGLTMTPIGRPVMWIKDLVDKGVISDHRYSVTVRNCTPQGGQPFLSQADIDRLSDSYLAIELPQRIHGEWEGAAVDAYFPLDDAMIRNELPSNRVKLGIGIDHGHQAGTQVAVLAAVDLIGSAEHSKAWAIDEAVSTGDTTTADDARAILRMLEANKLDHMSIDSWVGDVKLKWSKGSKSNKKLMVELENQLGFRPGRLPFRIRTHKKVHGTVFNDTRLIKSIMLRGGFVVRPQCEEVVKALRYWQGADDEYKHAVDGLRYATVDLLRGVRLVGSVPLYE